MWLIDVVVADGGTLAIRQEQSMPDLYTIWEASDGPNVFGWRCQLHGFIGQFPTKEAAERYVAAVKHERSRNKGMAPSEKVTTKKR